jgi:hypothetical protein
LRHLALEISTSTPWPLFRTRNIEISTNTPPTFLNLFVKKAAESKQEGGDNWEMESEGRRVDKTVKKS